MDVERGEWNSALGGDTIILPQSQLISLMSLAYSYTEQRPRASE